MLPDNSNVQNHNNTLSFPHKSQALPKRNYSILHFILHIVVRPDYQFFHNIQNRLLHQTLDEEH